MSHYAPRHSHADSSSRDRWSLAHILFLPLSFLYLELVLFFATTPSWSMSLLYIPLFSLSAGGIFYLFCSLGSSRLNRILTLVVTGVISVFFGVEYFVYQSFRTFMGLGAIFSGAGDVAADFSGTIFQLVLRGLWIILLFLLPFLLYLIFGKRFAPAGSANMRLRIMALIAIVVLYGGGLLSVMLSKNDRLKYWEEFHFDTAVHTFGLLAGTRLDGEYALFGGESAGGFTPQTPITDPSGEGEPGEEEPGGEETPEPPKVYGDNVMRLDFDALIAGESNETIRSIHQYVSSLTPTKQNEYTGLFKGKNLIFITAEAFSAEAIDPVRTPTLYRLATKGIQFKEYYQPAWGGSTSSGEYANTIGLVPTDGAKSMKDTIGHNLYLTIGNQLKRLNYNTVAYHNHSNTYYSRNQTHTNLGYESFIARGNGLEAGVAEHWPESDLEMMDYTVPLYAGKQPFSVYYMTVSGHCRYSWTGNYIAYKNKGEMANLNASETIKAYQATQLELEKGMASLLRQLEAAGIADDTVIVLSTDHYPYGLEKGDTWGNDQDYLAELYGYAADTPWAQDHSALIMWSGSLEKQPPIVVNEPVYSLDIIPTLSNLFGAEYDSRLLVGRDVFSDAEPLALWNGYSWVTDKGFYNNRTSTFTPRDGVTVSDDYVASIKAIVRNKITYSKNVLNLDYFSYLFK